MRIDKARHQDAPVQIDNLRIPGLEGSDVADRADGQNFTLPDRQRASPGGAGDGMIVPPLKITSAPGSVSAARAEDIRPEADRTVAAAAE